LENMNVRPLARLCGLIGGACWAVRIVLDDGVVGEVLQWGGLVLLFVGMVGLGTTLVSQGAVWLQVIVGVAFPLLVWSVLEVIHGSGEAVVVDGVFGIVIAAACLLALRPTGEGDDRPPRRHVGAHAR
jgi:hypothetical protein